jgi:hypothetical protein
MSHNFTVRLETQYETIYKSAYYQIQFGFFKQWIYRVIQVTGTCYGVDNRGSNTGRDRYFVVIYHAQADAGAHRISYTVSTRGSLTSGTAAWTWPLTYIQIRSQECVEIFLHCSIRRYSFVFKYRGNFTTTIVAGSL